MQTRRRAATWLLATALILSGCASGTVDDTQMAAGESPSPSAASTPAPTEPSPTSTPTPTPDAHSSDSSERSEDASTLATVVSDPERIRIPAIEVDAPIIDLGKTEQGGLEVPEDWDTTGWWTGGITPGRIGPAVIAGHIDSTEGPAVFFRLEELEPGDEIHVIDADGTEVTFTVDGMEQFPKAEFPTNEIYGPTSEPELRLITCGGPFDSSWGHYLDNIAVSATEVGTSA